MSGKDKKYRASFMRTALQWSNESTCTRKKVAAVLVRKNRIRAISYNGTVNGDDNCCEKEYHVCTFCKAEFERKEDADEHVNKICNIVAINRFTTVDVVKELHGDDEAIVHAEPNLIADCAANGIKTKKADIYVTLAPCIRCANILIQAKIKRVFYLEEYTNTKGIDKLIARGIKVIKLNLEDISC